LTPSAQADLRLAAARRTSLRASIDLISTLARQLCHRAPCWLRYAKTRPISDRRLSVRRNFGRSAHAGFVADQHLAEQLAEIGVILLMFGVGVQFQLEELLAVRRPRSGGAPVQSGATTALGAVLVQRVGGQGSAGIVFGVALSVASTVVLIRVLTDSRHLHAPAGQVAVGWLVVEDLLTVLVLVLMTALFGSSGQTDLLLTIGVAALKVGRWFCSRWSRERG
jgi:Kef-type K+ transport system membrane component KefB